MKTPFLNKICIFLIFCIRPLFGIAHCKYTVTCTQYAKWQLEEKPLLCALWMIFKRVFNCNPFL